MARWTVGLWLGAMFFGVVPVSAQAQNDRGRGLVEGGGGYAAFVDDSPISHGVIQGSTRWFLGSRVAVGPEVTYMHGPDEDRDWFVTGNVTVDAFRRSGGVRRVQPYVVAGAGLMHSTLPVGIGTFSSSEGAFTAGGGARITATRGWYLAPEARLGWELHWRIGAVLGRKF